MTTNIFSAAASLKSFEEAAAIARKGIDSLVGATPEPLRGKVVEAMSFAEGNVAAAKASAEIFAKGFEALSAEVTAYAKSSYETSVASTQSLLSVKSLDAAAVLANDLTKASVETSIAEATKLHELSLKMAQDALAPLTARYTLAVETLSKPLAA